MFEPFTEDSNVGDTTKTTTTKYSVKSRGGVSKKLNQNLGKNDSVKSSYSIYSSIFDPESKVTLPVDDEITFTMYDGLEEDIVIDHAPTIIGKTTTEKSTSEDNSNNNVTRGLQEDTPMPNGYDEVPDNRAYKTSISVELNEDKKELDGSEEPLNRSQSNVASSSKDKNPNRSSSMKQSLPRKGSFQMKSAYKTSVTSLSSSTSSFNDDKFKSNLEGTLNRKITQIHQTQPSDVTGQSQNRSLQSTYSESLERTQSLQEKPKPPLYGASTNSISEDTWSASTNKTISNDSSSSVNPPTTVTKTVTKTVVTTEIQSKSGEAVRPSQKEIKAKLNEMLSSSFTTTSVDRKSNEQTTAKTSKVTTHSTANKVSLQQTNKALKADIESSTTGESDKAINESNEPLSPIQEAHRTVEVGRVDNLVNNLFKDLPLTGGCSNNSTLEKKKTPEDPTKKFKFVVEGIDVPLSEEPKEEEKPAPVIPVEENSEYQSSSTNSSTESISKDPKSKKGFAYLKLDPKLATELKKKALGVTASKPHEKVETQTKEQKLKREDSIHDSEVQLLEARAKLQKREIPTKLSDEVDPHRGEIPLNTPREYTVGYSQQADEKDISYQNGVTVVTNERSITSLRDVKKSNLKSQNNMPGVSVVSPVSSNGASDSAYQSDNTSTPIRVNHTSEDQPTKVQKVEMSVSNKSENVPQGTNHAHQTRYVEEKTYFTESKITLENPGQNATQSHHEKVEKQSKSYVSNASEQKQANSNNFEFAQVAHHTSSYDDEDRRSSVLNEPVKIVKGPVLRETNNNTLSQADISFANTSTILVNDTHSNGRKVYSDHHGYGTDPGLTFTQSRHHGTQRPLNFRVQDSRQQATAYAPHSAPLSQQQRAKSYDHLVFARQSPAFRDTRVRSFTPTPGSNTSERIVRLKPIKIDMHVSQNPEVSAFPSPGLPPEVITSSSVKHTQAIYEMRQMGATQFQQTHVSNSGGTTPGKLNYIRVDESRRGNMPVYRNQNQQVGNNQGYHYAQGAQTLPRQVEQNRLVPIYIPLDTTDAMSAHSEPAYRIVRQPNRQPPVRHYSQSQFSPTYRERFQYHEEWMQHGQHDTSYGDLRTSNSSSSGHMRARSSTPPPRMVSPNARLVEANRNRSGNYHVALQVPGMNQPSQNNNHAHLANGRYRSKSVDAFQLEEQRYRTVTEYEQYPPQPTTIPLYDAPVGNNNVHHSNSFNSNSGRHPREVEMQFNVLNGNFNPTDVGEIVIPGGTIPSNAAHQSSNTLQRSNNGEQPKFSMMVNQTMTLDYAPPADEGQNISTVYHHTDDPEIVREHQTEVWQQTSENSHHQQARPTRTQNQKVQRRTNEVRSTKRRMTDADGENGYEENDGNRYMYEDNTVEYNYFSPPEDNESEDDDSSTDMPQVVRGSILIKNAMDTNSAPKVIDVVEDDDFMEEFTVEDNTNMFHNKFYQLRENPMYHSDDELHMEKTTKTSSRPEFAKRLFYENEETVTDGYSSRNAAPRRKAKHVRKDVTVTTEHNVYNSLNNMKVERELAKGREIPVTKKKKEVHTRRGRDESDGWHTLENGESATRTTSYESRSRRSGGGGGGASGGGGYVNKSEFRIKELLKDAPPNSVKQRINVEREEEEIIGPLEETNEGEGPDGLLNYDTISEKVNIGVQDGKAQLAVIVRCERIVPIRGVEDMFKKSSVIVTRLIEIDMEVTEERRRLFENIMKGSSKPMIEGPERKSKSRNSRHPAERKLTTKETFSLYKTFMGMAEHEEGTRQSQLKIDHRLEDERNAPDLDEMDPRMNGADYDSIDGDEGFDTSMLEQRLEEQMITRDQLQSEIGIGGRWKTPDPDTISCYSAVSGTSEILY